MIHRKDMSSPMHKTSSWMDNADLPSSPEKSQSLQVLPSTPHPPSQNLPVAVDIDDSLSDRVDKARVEIIAHT
ncbi:uncharacterized protein N7515_009404 [Penicillium bovifimosum]|uniref:Uncharacterized protein n=1 Tax=Penicillium bovifimosum TaxID=126998 RepID=A0A9W9GJ82_9EURO|nr:uncharacterized protein N7515_009404 [Penicillium bovifimosum]KAJ5121443.1 hypothetical protein N7515_009404 [Penicillium bovifimosum]